MHTITIRNSKLIPFIPSPHDEGKVQSCRSPAVWRLSDFQWLMIYVAVAGRIEHLCACLLDEELDVIPDSNFVVPIEYWSQNLQHPASIAMATICGERVVTFGSLDMQRISILPAHLTFWSKPVEARSHCPAVSFCERNGVLRAVTQRANGARWDSTLMRPALTIPFNHAGFLSHFHPKARVDIATLSDGENVRLVVLTPDNQIGVSAPFVNLPFIASGFCQWRDGVIVPVTHEEQCSLLYFPHGELDDVIADATPKPLPIQIPGSVRLSVEDVLRTA